MIQYNSKEISERIKEVAQRKKIMLKKVLEDVGLSFNTFSNMKTSMPKADNLAKIADYLDCSVDYLLGRVDDPAEYKNIERGEEKQRVSALELPANPQLQAIHVLFVKLDEPDQEYVVQKTIELLNAPKYKKGGGLSTAQKM